MTGAGGWVVVTASSGSLTRNKAQSTPRSGSHAHAFDNAWNRDVKDRPADEEEEEGGGGTQRALFRAREALKRV